MAADVLVGCAGSMGVPGASGSGGQTTSVMAPAAGRAHLAPAVAGGGGGSATGMPCDVQALLQTRCVALSLESADQWRAHAAGHTGRT